MRLLFFHAVAVLIVIFGANSEQWFRARPAPGRVEAWYRRAVERIGVPIWSTLLVWWAMVFLLAPPFYELSLRLFALHAVGIAHSVGTGWFITVLVQLVVVFPLVRWGARRFGLAPVFAVALLTTLGLMIAESQLRGLLGRPTWTDLAPRFAAHVVFGMALVDRLYGLGRREGLLALACLIALDIVAETGLLGQPWGRIASRLSELPLTVVLLAASGALAHLRVVATPLGWLGRHSLGLYLGQLITANFFVFALGGVCSAYGCHGGVYDRIDPWVYTGILLLGSALWMLVGNALLTGIAGLRGRALPLLDR